jgi:hypothetical protein
MSVRWHRAVIPANDVFFILVFDAFALTWLVHGGGLSGDCRNPPKFASHFIDNDANGSNRGFLMTLFNFRN